MQPGRQSHGERALTFMSSKHRWRFRNHQRPSHDDARQCTTASTWPLYPPRQPPGSRSLARIDPMEGADAADRTGCGKLLETFGASGHSPHHVSLMGKPMGDRAPNASRCTCHHRDWRWCSSCALAHDHSVGRPRHDIGRTKRAHLLPVSRNLHHLSDRPRRPATPAGPRRLAAENYGPSERRGAPPREVPSPARSGGSAAKCWIQHDRLTQNLRKWDQTARCRALRLTARWSSSRLSHLRL